MKKAIVFGAGNIGSVLIKKLKERDINIKYIVKSNGVFDLDLKKIAENRDWKKLTCDIDVAFISIPTISQGEKALEYSLYLLKKGKPVITCEKASLAYHWDKLKKYKNIFRYTASVGGGTKMLEEVSFFPKDKFLEIKGVVNGTLNYILDNLKKGISIEIIIKEVLQKGYCEPGAKTFEEIISAEMKDVILKTVIIANHSGLFSKTISKKDVEVILPSQDVIVSKRCIVSISKEKIQCGFIENNNAKWLPKGVNNVLYINGKKMAFGPGAGAEETASVMIEDYFPN